MLCTNVYQDVLLACMFHVQAVLVEVRWGCWSPWNWNCGWLFTAMWVLGLKPETSGRAIRVLRNKLSPQSLFFHFLNSYEIIVIVCMCLTWAPEGGTSMLRADHKKALPFKADINSMSSQSHCNISILSTPSHLSFPFTSVLSFFLSKFFLWDEYHVCLNDPQFRLFSCKWHDFICYKR